MLLGGAEAAVVPSGHAQRALKRDLQRVRSPARPSPRGTSLLTLGAGDGARALTRWTLGALAMPLQRAPARVCARPGEQLSPNGGGQPKLHSMDARPVLQHVVDRVATKGLLLVQEDDPQWAVLQSLFQVRRARGPRLRRKSLAARRSGGGTLRGLILARRRSPCPRVALESARARPRSRPPPCAEPRLTPCPGCSRRGCLSWTARGRRSGVPRRPRPRASLWPIAGGRIRTPRASGRACRASPKPLPSQRELTGLCLNRSYPTPRDSTLP